jgi:protein-disulfide isomerase
MSGLSLNRRAAALGLVAPLALSACHGAAGGSASVPDDMSLGNPNAKVSVVEYASVACPVCGRWYKDNWQAFKAKYIDTGKVHFTYREMLVGGSEEVLIAASGFLLARCAGKDKYFNVVDAVYSSQPGLFDDPRGSLLNVAKSMGMTEAQFDACVKNEDSLKALSARVDRNTKLGNVQATPTFVINGKALAAGYHPMSEIDAAIAAAQKA